MHNDDIISFVADMQHIAGVRLRPVNDYELVMMPNDEKYESLRHLQEYPGVNAQEAWDELPETITPVQVGIIDA